MWQMLKKNDQLRRRLGVFFLLASGVMLLLGFTLLRDRLANLGFLLYWMGCLGFTLLAAMTALLDLLVIRMKAREEQKKELKNVVQKEGSDPVLIPGENGRD